MENIGKDTDRLAKLIHDILDLEKLSTDRTELNIQSRLIDRTIKRAINGIEQIAAKRGVKVEFDQSEYLKGMYDEDRILQVLTNLLSNSLKFTDKEKGIIRILLEEKEQEIAIAVEDNGRGIPTEDHNYIFEKFYQSKNQNTKKPQGSGFGLAICKRIVESHSGNIWADREFRNGARLVFTIPKAK